MSHSNPDEIMSSSQSSVVITDPHSDEAVQQLAETWGLTQEEVSELQQANRTSNRFYASTESTGTFNACISASLPIAIATAAITVMKPTLRLLNKAKSVLPKDDKFVISSEDIIAKYVKNLPIMGMIKMVDELRKILPRQLGDYTLSDTLQDVLKPFIKATVKPGAKATETIAAGWGFTADELIGICKADDEGRAAMEEGIDTVGKDLRERSEENLISLKFYQIIVVTQYSHKHKLYSFGYSYASAKNLSLGDLFRATGDKKKALASMKLSSLASLADSLSGSANKGEINVITDDDYFRVQDAALN